MNSQMTPDGALVKWRTARLVLEARLLNYSSTRAYVQDLLNRRFGDIPGPLTIKAAKAWMKKYPKKPKK